MPRGATKEYMQELSRLRVAKMAARKERGETSREFFARLRWLSGAPLLSVVEPYRMKIFEAFLDERDPARDRPRYNLALTGRAKKNWKSADLVLAALRCLLSEPAEGRTNECFILANDEDQAGDDLSLAKRLIDANPWLDGKVLMRQKAIERLDGEGRLMILPAGDVVGAHGKTYRFCGFDEIHAYKTWDLFEALALDPHRPDAQQWITSYASIYHRPGVPLFDLTAIGRAGRDPRMLFSWYAADYATDPAALPLEPEARANPSLGTFADPGYLDQQRLRLPAHKFRRLHLNLPGLPEGSAFAAEPVMDSVERGVASREPAPGTAYHGFIDMSGGSNDDATLAVAHRDRDGRVMLDLVMSQGQPPPFDPQLAVERFAPVLRRYGLARATADSYAGETFAAAFRKAGVTLSASSLTKSEIYEAFEVPLNARRCVLLDAPLVEQQLLGLVWRGSKIDHPGGEHDDWANAAAGALVLADGGRGEHFEPETMAVRRHWQPEPGKVVYRGEDTIVVDGQAYRDARGFEPAAEEKPAGAHDHHNERHRSTCRACRKDYVRYMEALEATSPPPRAARGPVLAEVIRTDRWTPPRNDDDDLMPPSGGTPPDVFFGRRDM